MEKRSKGKSNPAFLFILIMLFAFSVTMLKESRNEQAVENTEINKLHKTISTINWEKSFKEAGIALKSNPKNYLDTVKFGVENEAKEIFINVSLKGVPGDKELINDLEQMIYHISNSAATGTDLRPPSKNTLDYGGVFDDYNIVIGVSSEGDLNNPDDWLVHYKIPKGSHKKIKIRKNES